jgi:hypothetical protein
VEASAEPTASSAGASARRTLCGSSVAEARVAQDLARLATGIDSEVGDALRALVLVGAFARGEGGIIERDGEPSAADPGYELLALFKRRPERHQPALRMMAATWGRLLRARVAIRALSTHELPSVPVTRFWFQTGQGQYRTLIGNASLAHTIPGTSATALGFDEPALALCEGLTALALAGLEPAATRDRELDAMQRAVLACSDALLLRRKRYAATLSARAQALSAVDASATLRAAHDDAVRFLRRPDIWIAECADVSAWLEQTRHWLCALHLELEADRTGSARNVFGYLCHPQPLHFNPSGEDSPRAKWAARIPLLERVTLARRLADPLERLLRCSTALAFARSMPACRRQVAHLLNLPRSAQHAAKDTELADGLRALAKAVFERDLGQPYSGFYYEVKALATSPEDHAIGSPRKEHRR